MDFLIKKPDKRLYDGTGILARERCRLYSVVGDWAIGWIVRPC